MTGVPSATKVVRTTRTSVLLRDTRQTLHRRTSFWPGPAADANVARPVRDYLYAPFHKIIHRRQVEAPGFMIDAIAALGDTGDINCWSGIPWHFGQAARAI